MDIDSLPYRPCVGLMLLNREDKIFAGQRLDSPNGAWQMPQGGIDPGETLDPGAFTENPDADLVHFVVGDRNSDVDHTLRVEKVGNDVRLVF